MDLRASMLRCSPFDHSDHSRDYDGSINTSASSSSICLNQTNSNFPKKFIWPLGDTIHATDDEELNEPVVDLEGFFKGDESATQQAARLIRSACLTHGFFQVVNHGIDSQLIGMAHDHIAAFFKLPFSKKLRAQKKSGSMWGFSSAHNHRFLSRLPWKETLSFGFHDKPGSHSAVLDFFTSTLGKEF